MNVKSILMGFVGGFVAAGVFISKGMNISFGDLMKRSLKGWKKKKDGNPSDLADTTDSNI